MAQHLWCLYIGSLTVNTAICVWWVFFIKFYYFIALNKLHCRKSNVELFTSLSELCKSCPDFSLVWKNYIWSFNGGMSKVFGSYLLEKFATYQWREAKLSLGFYCFPTFTDFVDEWKLKIIDIPNCQGWSGTIPENWECFYFPDTSQISVMVSDHSRQMKSEICTIRVADDGFCSLQYSKLLGSNPPTTHRRGISWERHKRKRKTSGNYSIYQQDMGWSEKITL